MQHNRRGGGEWPACYGRSGDDLPRPILIFVAAKKNGFACGGRSGNEVPRPILIFAAAKENGSACRPLRPRGCSDSGFQGVNLGITAGFSPESPSGLQ